MTRLIEEVAKAVVKRWQARIDFDGWSDDTCEQMIVEALDDASRALAERNMELEQALRLHLAIGPDDPLLMDPIEQEVVRLRDEVATLRGARGDTKSGQKANP